MVVSELLGHQSSTSRSTRNSPALPDLEAAAAEALDTILADPALAEAG
jgi:hypothetical protein